MTTSRTQSGFSDSIGHVMKVVATSKAAWFFATAWLSSVVVLAVGGHPIPLAGIMVGVVLLLISLVVTVATEPVRDVPVIAGRPRRRVWVHLGLALVFIALTGWNNLAFHNVIARNPDIPLWNPLVEWLQRRGEEWFGEGLATFLVNPITYVVIPLAVLLLVGARPSTLGFARGHRVGRTLLICCALPLAWFAYNLISGQLTIMRLLGRLASNFMQNGFMEEFLFRGVLQTRLRMLAGPGWALVLQALVFGVWHLGVGYTNTAHAGLLPAIASTIVQQSLLGLTFGILFQRTRNLLVPSMAHIALNSMG